MIVLLMKKTFLGFGLVLSLSLVAGAVAVATRETPYSVSASSYSVRSVPTTIDLNDASESTIRSYYSSLNLLSSSERQGSNLLKNLKPILKNGQKYLSYGSSATTAVWQAYEIVDRDWEKSPASAIAGYNASTNVITGYSYGKSSSNVGSNPYIHALYVNRDATNETKAWGDHTQTNYGINQEHVWPKSLGFENNTPAAGARGDLMHLWAGNGRVNGVSHNNYPYGYVDKSKSYDDAGSYRTYLSGNLKGVSKSLGGSVTVFEPQDSDKGDIARCCFYMAARYNYLSGSDSDGIDAGNPNLEITNNLSDWSNSGYQSTTTKTGKMSIIQDLLEWNRIDPPDEWEKHRNNILFNSFTNNRNPFIDFPEWAEFIWGKSVDGSYNATSTGVANPASDVISDFSTTPSGSVTISKTTASVAVGETVALTATASDSSTVSWASSADSIATVKDGVVTGVSEGNATITATATIGGQNYSASCEVTVTPAPSVSISVPSATLQVGDSVTLTATASDDSAITWVSSAPGVASVADGVVTGVSEGNATITATATIGGKNYSATCEITVIAAPADPSSVKLTEIALDTSKVKKNFFVGDTFTSEGLIVTARYDNGTSKTVTPSEITKPDMSTPGTKTVTVSFTDNGVTKSSAYYITVSPVQHTITASCEKSFFVGESIKKSDITVKDENGAAVTDFTMSDETDGQYTFLYSDAASGGAETDKKFTISHNDASTVLIVKVSRRAPNQDATAANLADFLLYKDADQMSDADWDEAIRIFNAMSKEERVTFMTSTDYILKSAMTRFVSELKVYESGGDYEVKGHERSVTPSTDPKQGGIPNLYLYIAIGAGALLVLIVVIIILVHSKKARKVAKKAAKKAIKSSTKKKK